MADAPLSQVCLVGHPYAPIGMGQHVRLSFRAMRAATLRPRLADVFGLHERAPRDAQEFSRFESSEFSEINVFHINGNEVEQVLAHTVDRQRTGAYNIVYPMWELSRYPEPWARQLERFDEVWAPSIFVRDALAKAVDRPVVHMPVACHVHLDSFLGRRYFGLPEKSYCFLFFFDNRSYQTRKNPEAVIDAFEAMHARVPNADAVLVIKVNGAEQNVPGLEALRERAARLRHPVLFIPRQMTDNEVKNLVRCCDAFVSLHRSEGFGLGMAEAMCLGKPVIATGYSGNMDFCDADTVRLVPFTLVPVPDGAYPFSAGQVWAEPDVRAAADCMASLVVSPESGYALGRRAALRLRTGFSLRVAGARLRARLDAIQQQIGGGVPSSVTGVRQA